MKAEQRINFTLGEQFAKIQHLSDKVDALREALAERDARIAALETQLQEAQQPTVKAAGARRAR